jgi:hypothetical protein
MRIFKVTLQRTIARTVCLPAENEEEAEKEAWHLANIKGRLSSAPNQGHLRQSQKTITAHGPLSKKPKSFLAIGGRDQIAKRLFGTRASQASRASRPVDANPFPPLPTLPSGLKRTVQYHRPSCGPPMTL